MTINLGPSLSDFKEFLVNFTTMLTTYSLFQMVASELFDRGQVIERSFQTYNGSKDPFGFSLFDFTGSSDSHCNYNQEIFSSKVFSSPSRAANLVFSCFYSHRQRSEMINPFKVIQESVFWV